MDAPSSCGTGRMPWTCSGNPARRCAARWASRRSRAMPAAIGASARREARIPSRMALYHDPELLRDHPSFPAISALAMVARPRPVAPYYLMLSTMLQPEFSAVLVGTKTPRQAVAQARYQVDHLLKGIR